MLWSNRRHSYKGFLRRCEPSDCGTRSLSSRDLQFFPRIPNCAHQAFGPIVPSNPLTRRRVEEMDLLSRDGQLDALAGGGAGGAGEAGEDAGAYAFDLAVDDGIGAEHLDEIDDQ